jgi:DNA-binding IclR family transcriptional regulator
MSETGEKFANQSTQVAFRIIEEMAPLNEGIRLTDLARRLDMPKARVYRFLQALLASGYVRQDPETERYRLTLKLFHIGQAVADGTQLLSIARPVMVALRNKVGETTTLSVPEASGMRVVDIVRTETPVQIVTKPGAVLAFHASAQGKLALAFGPKAIWDHVRAHPLEALTAKTNTDVATLEAEVAKARQRFWAVAPEESLPGVNALSAPIFDSTNDMVATITIAGSVQTIKVEPDQEQVEAVLAAARTISQHLGCTEYYS